MGGVTRKSDFMVSDKVQCNTQISLYARETSLCHIGRAFTFSLVNCIVLCLYNKNFAQLTYCLNKLQLTYCLNKLQLYIACDQY